MKKAFSLVLGILLHSAIGTAEIRQNPGSKQPLPHEKYIRAVSEAVSPIQQVYVKARDGLYIAAALRKPAGDGPFPAKPLKLR